MVMRRLGLVLAIAAGTSALAVPAANADLTGSLLPSCGSMTQPFAQFGDFDGYCAMTNNGFESGTFGWTVSGPVQVVDANEPWYVNGEGEHALALGPGATAISSALPISLIDPWYRMFARSLGANGALHAQVRFYGLTGNLTGAVDMTDLAPWLYPVWAPTQQLLSLLALPLGTSSARLVLTSQATSGTWQVDDVFLDPMVSRIG